LGAVGCGDTESFVVTGSPVQASLPGTTAPLVEVGQLLEFGLDGTAYRLDFSTFRVARLSSTGQVVWEVGGLGDGSGLFNFPVALATDARGRIYVADRGNGEIDVLDSDGNLVATFGDEQLSVARDMALDAQRERIYIADGPNHRVLVFSLQGALLDTLGQFGLELPQDLNSPSGVAVAPNGDLHVVDSGNAQVQVYSAELAFLRTYGSRGSDLGQFEIPRAIAIDSLGQSFVADGVAGLVTRFAADGQALDRFQPELADGTPVQPQYLSMGPDNRLIVSGQPGFVA
jgi:DNA-binding beta-propeller fold protein YncE